MKDELPKLYRVVYANIEWLEDSDYGGIAHKQESGAFSVKVRRVLSELGEPFFVCVDSWWKDDNRVISFLNELNDDPDPYWFEWSNKPFKYIPPSYDLHHYGN